ncbi:MAG TPA: ATP-grasp domain-containing protein [Candidatus Binataceae bacterium]|nr:ATP-grasp domain-containing protein [Candidatus Binataceae bacterium]
MRVDSSPQWRDLQELSDEYRLDFRLPERRPLALILDRRAVMAIEMCRILAASGYAVDVLGEAGSPAFHSRFLRQAMVSPPVQLKQAFLARVSEVVEEADYDAIFVCNEEVLEALLDLPAARHWRGLALTPPEQLRQALSRKQMLRVAAQAGVSTPRTLVPADEGELEAMAWELGFPLIVKGDRGEAGNHVRLVTRPADLAAAYAQIAELEHEFGAPSLQEYVRGRAFSVGGLFDGGRPLRVCAHLKLAGVPPLGGLTAKGVTIKLPGLLEAAFAVFEALSYRGLGHAEFIQDAMGHFKFLEVNPRVWGTLAVSHYAGVDMLGTYAELARGGPVAPDLRYRAGVRFHRLLREARLIQRHPWSLPRVLADCCNPAIRSDFCWTDAAPHLAALSLRGKAWLRKPLFSRAPWVA